MTQAGMKTVNGRSRPLSVKKYASMALQGIVRYTMIGNDDLSAHPQIRSTSSDTIYLAPVLLTFISASRYVGEVGQLAPSGWFKYHLGNHGKV